MILASLRDIVNFWSRMIVDYNKVNAEVKSTEKIIIILKAGQITRRGYSVLNPTDSTEGADYL